MYVNENTHKGAFMLKHIPSVISPELLMTLSEMGHGDEIAIADGNFPSASMNKNVIRLDGNDALPILKGILTLFPLDKGGDSVNLMAVTPGDDVKTPIWAEYHKACQSDPAYRKYCTIERFAFYERAKKAYAVIATGEKALYANIILRKGVVVED